MSGPAITYEVAEGVASVALDRPQTRNALSSELLTELREALLRVREDDRARVLVLRSTHDKVFSSGASLSGFAAEISLVQKHEEIGLLPEIFGLLAELGKPSICAAGGHVLAGALGIALSCDLIVASEGAEFGTPEVNVGAFPFMVSALLRRAIGTKKATEMMLLGERIEAAEAERIGLVNRVVPAAEFETAVAEWAAALAAKSPLVMRLGKDALRRQGDMGIDDALDYLRAQLTLAFSTDDLHEGVEAFFEKREPRWRGT